MDRRHLLHTTGAGLAGLAVSQLSEKAKAGELSNAVPDTVRSIRSFGVHAAAGAQANKRALQKALDWASSCGGAVLVDPTEDPYPMDGGLRLRKNASLIGFDAARPRACRHPQKVQPVGSVFRITDQGEPFLTVESSTQVRGMQFWYPDQTRTDPSKVIAYPVTIQSARDQNVFGVIMSDLTFYGDFQTFDFRGARGRVSELLRFEHCFAFPMSGRFIDIDYCYDIPRILHCHVNPAIRRLLDGDMARAVTDSVVARKTFAFAIDHTDNAQLIDLFTFGTYGGIRLGPATYGQMTNFNFDCVAVGIHKTGDSQFNRNWQISQGSIIANTGEPTADIHPIIIDGKGHTALTNVECFSGRNGAITTPGTKHQGKRVVASNDFVLIDGREHMTVTMTGCRMANYLAEDPVTIKNPNASVSMFGCYASRLNTNKALPLKDGLMG